MVEETSHTCDVHVGERNHTLYRMIFLLRFDCLSLLCLLLAGEKQKGKSLSYFQKFLNKTLLERTRKGFIFILFFSPSEN